MYRYSFLFLGLLFCYSCTSKKGSCKAEIENLIKGEAESEFADLYGFSAEASWHLDQTGNRKVHRICYSNEKKERIYFYNTPKVSTSDIALDTLDVYEKLALELGFQSSYGKTLFQEYSSHINYVINQYLRHTH